MKFVEYQVPRALCPPGEDWEPVLHRTEEGHVYAVSAWPQLVVGSIPTFGQLSDPVYSDGAWVCPPWCCIIGDVVARKSIQGEVVTITVEHPSRPIAGKQVGKDDSPQG